MKRPISCVAMLVALLAPTVADARDSAYGVAIRGASVNGDHSVTIAWQLESANVFNQSLAVDGSVVRSGSDRATSFTTRPLSEGSHTITIEVRELFETYTRSDSSCVVSGGHWVCARNWRDSMTVSVPYEMTVSSHAWSGFNSQWRRHESQRPSARSVPSGAFTPSERRAPF